MKHRHGLLAAVAVLIAGLGLAGCGANSSTSSLVRPVTLKLISSTGLHQVTLTQAAAQDLGIQTQPAASTPVTAAVVVPAGRTVTLAIPVSAVIYDPSGKPWTYTVVGPRAYARTSIVIDHISGDTAYLLSGPPAGTPVVTVGAPELLGAEYGVGEE
jgi:hypothetical protein